MASRTSSFTTSSSSTFSRLGVVFEHTALFRPLSTVGGGSPSYGVFASLYILTASCVFFLQQALLLVMRLPPTRAKVEAELGKARQDIITKLVPQGTNVTRHVCLPSHGQSAQWIAEEMEKMDAESENTGLWKQGKLSGAVYRTSTSHHCEDPFPHLTRRGRRYGKDHCGRLQTVLRLKPAASRCVPGWVQSTLVTPLLLTHVSSACSGP
jgi:hypothetical protein